MIGSKTIAHNNRIGSSTSPNRITAAFAFNFRRVAKTTLTPSKTSTKSHPIGSLYTLYKIDPIGHNPGKNTTHNTSVKISIPKNNRQLLPPAFEYKRLANL